jgi:glutamate 5-kinase
MILDLKNYKKIVIKIGSSLLVENGTLRRDWLQNFAHNVAQLIKENHQIVIVTSGAIALGKENLSVTKTLSLEQKQAAAAIGQIKLMLEYSKVFAEFDLNVAQILLTAADCNSRARYLNSQNTIETLLKNKIIPIINENDSVAVEEIKIGDNDRLAARALELQSAAVSKICATFKSNSAKTLLYSSINFICPIAAAACFCSSDRVFVTLKFSFPKAIAPEVTITIW